MRSKRHYIGVALLPLLILAGLIGPGGWYCADGSRCEPLLAATCCCADAQKVLAGQDCCPGEAAPRSDVGMRPSCGCYYRAELLASAALLTATQSLANTVSLPLSASPTVAPPVPISVAAPPTDAPPPPRFLHSPRKSRAPPAA